MNKLLRLRFKNPEIFPLILHFQTANLEEKLRLPTSFPPSRENQKYNHIRELHNSPSHINL